MPAVRPSERVLDLFAIPGDLDPIGTGNSVRAGDLVLSSGRDAGVAQWLNPILARLAVRMDERPGRRARDLRLAVPVPARDGSWVVEGWGASRWEPGTESCTDLEVQIAAGRVLHAEFASAVPQRPEGLDAREDRWARAERWAFSTFEHAAAEPSVRELLAELAGSLGEDSIGPNQLVHGDLSGNLLMDAAGAAVVIDVSPYWRPVLWAEALLTLDAVLQQSAQPDVLAQWRTGAAGHALARAGAFRLLSDPHPEVERYREALLGGS